MSKPEIVLCAPVRTPIGIYGGALKDTPAIELARTKFIFLPADGARLTFIGDYSNHVDSMAAYRVYPNTISGFTRAAGPFRGLGYNTDTDTQPRTTVSSGGLSLRWDQTIGDLNFASISA